MLLAPSSASLHPIRAYAARWTQPTAKLTGITRSPSEGLRDVVCEVVDDALDLASHATHVAVLVERRLVGVEVGRLDLPQDRPVPVHPAEVVVEDERQAVVVDVLEAPVHGAGVGVVPSLLGLERVDVAAAYTTSRQQHLGLPPLSADVVEQQLPDVLVEGGVVAVRLLSLPPTVAGHRRIDAVQRVVLRQVRAGDLDETVDLQA